MRKKKRLLWQLYPAFLLTALLSIIPVTWYAAGSLKQFFLKQTTLDLEARAHMVEDRILPFLDPLDRKAVDAACKGVGKSASTRITVIGPSGEVYGDSYADPATMENHLNRPEVRAAFETGKGQAVRYSSTLQKELMYVGIAVHKNARTIAVIRASVPVSSVNVAVRGMQEKIALAGLFIALLSAAASLLVSRLISRPIEEIRNVAETYSAGDFEASPPLSNIKEIGDLSRAMKGMAGSIHDKIRTITRQRNELDTVLNSMVEGVIAIDLNERILSINGTAARLFHVQERKSAGKSIQELARNTHLFGFVRRALREDSPFEEDIAIWTDNKDRILHARASFLLDAEGKRIGALLVLGDVTRVRRLENIRREFVANVSHELKTPITAVKGFVETLLDGALDNPNDARRFLDIIQKHAGRLEAVIEDLLRLSRIEQEAENGQVQFEETGLKAVLESAVLLCREKAESKGTEVRLDCDEGIRAMANPRLLEQAVWNLIDNAIQYSPGGTKVLVKAADEAEGIKISVTDQGPGISPEHIPRIFERFYRADKGRSRALGGTGLGLAIAKHIIQAHGGKITVESAVGKGSTFIIHMKRT